MGVILGRGGRPIYCGEGIIGRMDKDMTPSSQPVFFITHRGAEACGAPFGLQYFWGARREGG